MGSHERSIHSNKMYACVTYLYNNIILNMVVIITTIFNWKYASCILIIKNSHERKYDIIQNNHMYQRQQNDCYLIKVSDYKKMQLSAAFFNEIWPWYKFDLCYHGLLNSLQFNTSGCCIYFAGDGTCVILWIILLQKECSANLSSLLLVRTS